MRRCCRVNGEALFGQEVGKGLGGLGLLPCFDYGDSKDLNKLLLNTAELRCRRFNLCRFTAPTNCG